MSKGSWSRKFAFLPIRIGQTSGSPIVWLCFYRERELQSGQRIERHYRGRKYAIVIDTLGT